MNSPSSTIEIIADVPRGCFRHVLFDFDGTISLLREGWQQIMAPVMIEIIAGNTEPTQEIIDTVHNYIDESTGIQTILQMEWLVQAVDKFDRVPQSARFDARAYKAIYNARLMEPVQERLEKLASGELPLEDAMLRGARDFIQRLAAHDLHMYIFSGTDRADVQREAVELDVARYFSEIWGALDSIEEYSKDKILRELIETHNLHGAQVLIIGDGPVEIRAAKAYGCVALGVASDEAAGHGWNPVKRERLAEAGADVLVPDFGATDALVEYLFP